MASPPFDHLVPPEVAAERRRGKRKGPGRAFRLSITLTLLALIGYCVFCASAPLPNLDPEIATSFTTSIEADPTRAEEAVRSFDAPTGLGWTHSEHAWSNSDEAVPIASLTKIITALVCQNARPLEPGSNGDIYTVSDADQIVTNEVLAQNGIAYPYPVGTQLTARDMMTLMLLPSSNDTTMSYANWVFGSTEAFLTAVDDWAATHGFESLTIVEASGLSELNVATLSELVAIGRLALADPAVAEIIQLPVATVPLYGEVENTNPLIDASGVVGVKTGTTLAAGYNLITAQDQDIEGRAVTAVSVVLGRESDDDRRSSSEAILVAAADMMQVSAVAAEGEQVGVVTTWDGTVVEVVADASAEAQLLPGEVVTREAQLTALHEAAAGASAGVLAVDGPTDSHLIPVITAAPIEDPGFWWRFTHPGVLGQAFGSGA